MSALLLLPLILLSSPPRGVAGGRLSSPRASYEGLGPSSGGAAGPRPEEARLRVGVDFPEAMAAHALGRRVAVPHGVGGASSIGSRGIVGGSVVEFGVRAVALPLFEAAGCDRGWAEGIDSITRGVRINPGGDGAGDDAATGRFVVTLTLPPESAFDAAAPGAGGPGCERPRPEDFHYEVIVSAGSVDLRKTLSLAEIREAATVGGDGPTAEVEVDVDLGSTVESEFLQRGHRAIAPSMVVAAKEELAVLLKKSDGYHRGAVRDVVARQLGEGRDGARPPPTGAKDAETETDRDGGRRKLLTATTCSTTGSAGSRICYQASDEVVYNLVRGTDIVIGTTAGVDRWGVGFTTYPGSVIRKQYSTSDGVEFESVHSGSFFAQWQVVERNGFAELKPPRCFAFQRGDGIRIRFTNPNQRIMSFGFDLVDGPNYYRPVQRHPRRAFRVTMYDYSHAAIHQYRWFIASTKGNNFYGATMGDVGSSLKTWGPIAYVEVTFEECGFAAIANLVYSSINVATTINAGGSTSGTPLTLNDNLGWRARGNWQKLTSAASGTYLHPYNGDTSRSGTGSSGGPYWNCPYGTSSDGDTLTSPAFTLTNLPVWDPKDDDPSQWMVGISDSSGASHTVNSGHRIPSGISSSCSCATGSEFCCYLQTDLFTFWESSATMHSHWSHNHFSSSADLHSSYISSNDPAGSTQRWIEYSMDNGKTWVNLFWWEDANHRGSDATWHQNHMHAFADSDMTNEVLGTDFNGDPAVNGTDFDKNGTDDYATPGEDWNLDGAADSLDAREWDTEFYLNWVNNPASTGSASATYPTARTTLGGTTYNFKVSDLEAPSIMYRFRFVGPATPSAGSCPVSCAGWSVDDVAFSNDEPTQGYYTNFGGSYDSSFS